jgi:asparagine synthase (glutamine-hydrolysing)
MCGLVGILRLDGGELDAGVEATLRSMIGAIAYRGPDEQRVVRAGPFALGFRRLSIVDIEGGSQPFASEDGLVLAAANGAIYNHRELRAGLRDQHRFASASDCEILLHLYEERGAALVDDLIGMYGLCVWDARRRRLLLARDRFGIKPLYYAVADGLLLFASEIKALVRHPACPRAFDWEAALEDAWVSGEAATSYGPPSAFFRDIRPLPAGHRLVAEIGRSDPQPEAYWHLPTPDADPQAPDRREQDWVDSYRALLADSVRKCLMSDVEMGVFLSGGVDSSAVCALAREHAGAFHTFTVLSRSTFANGDARHAARLAGRLGLPNHQLVFDWREHPFTADDWRSLVWLSESPLCGAEQLYKFSLHRYARSVRPRLKVILTGQGSDEFNGGYSAILALEGQAGWPDFYENVALLHRRGLFRNGNPKLATWEEQTGHAIFQPAFLASRPAGGRAIDEPWAAYLATKARDLQIFNLWHEDRTAAGNSIENRVPFLDHRLVELCCTIPRARWASLFWDKQILRAAVADLLDDEFARRPKVAFFHGAETHYTHRLLLDVLCSNGRELVDEAFAAPSRMAEIFDRDTFEELLDAVVADPLAMHAELVIRLVNMGLLDRNIARADLAVASPALEAITVRDWDEEERAVARRLGVDEPAIDLAQVPAFADGAGLAVAVSPTSEAVLLKDGQVCFTLDPSGPWFETLRAVDGQANVAELLERIGARPEDVLPQLTEAVEAGILVLVPPR